MQAAATPFPVLRWAALLWMAVWLPAYVHVWGWANLLRLCDIAVILGCAGFWWGNSLLVSSQELSSLLPSGLWCLDAGWRLAAGHHLVGGTEYMWDAHYPLWVRLLSLFHIALPLALLWAIRKVGYDRRALAFQAGIAAVMLVVSRFVHPELNLNYAYGDPLWHREWGPAPVHLKLILIGMILLLYWPAHLLLKWAFPASRSGGKD